MKSTVFAVVAAVVLTAVPADAGPRARVETSKGTFVLELDSANAPATVENFVAYAEDGFFDGTIFHRVIPGFMIQGGGFTPDLVKKDTKAPIRNEANNGVANARGTVAMARTGDPHSATAQWFVNTVDNTFLNHTAESSRGWGYAVFGRVVEGMEVVDAISSVPTGVQGRMQDVPKEPVLLQKVEIVAEEEASSETPEEAGTEASSDAG